MEPPGDFSHLSSCVRRVNGRHIFMDENMARKRMIDPEFWSDEEVGQWSYATRLFYIGLWNFSDDEGRFKAHKQLLKSQIFPYDKHISIEKLKVELGNKVQWYCDEKTNNQYGFVCNFLKYQRIDRPTPSQLPPPPKTGFDEQSPSNQRGVPPKLKEVKLKEVKVNTTEDERAIFESARKLYPHTKRGLDTEFKDFQKKHRDWRQVLPLLKAAIEKQIEWRKNANGDFRPEWKNFQTWTNQRCWELEMTTTNTHSSFDPEAARQRELLLEKERNKRR